MNIIVKTTWVVILIALFEIWLVAYTRSWNIDPLWQVNFYVIFIGWILLTPFVFYQDWSK